ncbi:MAG: hypothetical protein KDC98_05495 [Planctomycetes bacterium]|nr:hypothetical protein [Planctomycetota bacterium]
MLRLLGFLLLCLLLFAGFGYYRGWYSIATVEAGGKTGITFDIDKDRIRDDTKAAAGKLGELSAQAAAKLRELATTGDDGGSRLEGGIAAVDAATGTIRLAVGGESFELRVPESVSIQRDGVAVPLAQLKPGASVRVALVPSGDTLSLQRIDLVP